MDISQFLDVRCDVVDDVEEVDLPALPAAGKKPSTGGGINPLKRPTATTNGASPLPPSKRAKPASSPAAGRKQGGGPAVMPLRKILPSPLAPKRPPAGGGSGLVPSPAAKQAAMNARKPQHGPGNPVTWKYKQLPENMYNGDIKKADLLKEYEPEKCICKAPENSDPACGEGCINRSTYTECDKEVCPHGDRCSNQRLQRRQYAPGLERFMTQKKGWGVRARQSIPSGTLILEYMGEMCSSSEFEKRMMTRYKGDTHHYCLALDSKTVIDAQRAGSECRFVNHSCDPNCEMQKWNVNGLYRMAVFAKRDILPGEEVTYDYNFSLFDRNQGQVCKCGAKQCRGVIGGKGKDYLITVDANKKALVSASPNSLNNQITADAKFFASKIPADDFAWIKMNAPKPGQLEQRQVKCTVCNTCLNLRIRGSVQRHPELGVVLCMTCRQAYGRGGWPKDAQGSDEFCRWCSEGGQIYLCDFCPKAFCHKCLKWNLGKKYLTKIDEEEKWQCVACDGKLLRSAQALFYGIHLYQKATNSTSPGATAATNNGKPAKGAASPKKQSTGKQQQAKPAANPAILNGRNNLTVVRHVPSPGRSPAAAAQRGSPAPMPPRHFVDSMLLEADRACNRMKVMINDIRKGWVASGMKKCRNDKTISDTTHKIRKALVAAMEDMGKVDDKVVNLYNSKMKVPLETPTQNGNGKEENSDESQSKDKIHDVSVDELEANGDPLEVLQPKDQEEKGAASEDDYVPIEVDVEINEMTNGDQEEDTEDGVEIKTEDKEDDKDSAEKQEQDSVKEEVNEDKEVDKDSINKEDQNDVEEVKQDGEDAVEKPDQADVKEEVNGDGSLEDQEDDTDEDKSKVKSNKSDENESPEEVNGDSVAESQEDANEEHGCAYDGEENADEPDNVASDSEAVMEDTEETEVEQQNGQAKNAETNEEDMEVDDENVGEQNEKNIETPEKKGCEESQEENGNEDNITTKDDTEEDSNSSENNESAISDKENESSDEVKKVADKDTKEMSHKASDEEVDQDTEDKEENENESKSNENITASVSPDNGEAEQKEDGEDESGEVAESLDNKEEENNKEDAEGSDEDSAASDSRASDDA